VAPAVAKGSSAAANVPAAAAAAAVKVNGVSREKVVAPEQLRRIKRFMEQRKK
jgi:saccharopine dehydrogenase-like NADP-dependent oxidoreductase